MSLSTPVAFTVSQDSRYQVSTDRLSRLCWVAAIMLLLTHAVLVWQTRSPAITPAANDDAQYFLLARSLRGFHYQDTHLLGAPIHAQYPPVYPALIAVATGVFGEHVDVAAAVTLLCSLLALLLVYDMARRLASPLVGVLVLAPLALNAHLIGYAGRLASEPAYMAFSFAALWASVAFPSSRRTLMATGLFAVLAALTRSIGLSLIAALLVHWILQRRFKVAAIFAAAASVTVGAWLYWTAVAPDQITARSYAAVATTTGRHLPGVLGMLEVRTVNFFKTYVARYFTAGMEFPTTASSTVDNVLWILLIGILGGLGLWSVRKRFPLLPLYVLAFLGLLLVYPFKLTRFFMPIAPLLLLAMFLGVVELARRWKPSVAVAIAVLLSGAAIAGAAPRALNMVRSLKHCDRSNATNSPSCFSPEANAFYAATRLADAVLPRDAVVLTIKEATFSYYTGRLVYHPDLAYQKSNGDLLGFLDRRGVHYILINAFAGWGTIAKDLLPGCRQIAVLGQFEPHTALFQILKSSEPLPAVRNSCPLLEEWSRTPEEPAEDQE